MLRRATMLRLSTSIGGANFKPQRIAPHVKSQVSFARAPGFQQQPIATLSHPVDKVPPTDVGAYVIPNVITEEEEKMMLEFTNPLFDRLPFNEGHLDGLIHHYKEFYRPYDRYMAGEFGEDNDFFRESIERGDQEVDASSVMNAERTDVNDKMKETVQKVFGRCHQLAEDHLPHIPLVNRVHFLRIHGDGFIRAHVDESRNSSGIVAGLTLGSGRVMNLTHKDHPDAKVDLLIAPRSFYILASRARYEWEHSVDWEEDDASHLHRIHDSNASASTADGRLVPATPDKKAVADGELVCDKMKSSLAGDSTLSEAKQHKAGTVIGSPVMFEGKESGLFRDTRTAIIFRGVSPMELMMRRMNAKRQQQQQ